VKHGEKYFVYKRLKSSDKQEGKKSTDENAISLYPNPNNGKLTFSFHSDQKDNLKIRIFDDQGKEVFSESIKDFSGDYTRQLDLSSNGKGNYILKISQGNKTFSKKFLIQ
jgi:hypothetical protein